MLGHYIETGLSTLLVCSIVTLFSFFTAKFWAWFFKIDMLLFWMSTISRRLEKDDRKKETLSGKTKWKEAYQQILGDRREN